MNRSVKNGQRTKNPLMQETKGNYIRGGVELRQDLCANQFADSSHTNAMADLPVKVLQRVVNGKYHGLFTTYLLLLREKKWKAVPGYATQMGCHSF